MWDTARSRIAFKKQLEAHHVYNVCWSPDEKKIAISTDTATVRLYELDSSKEVNNFTMPTAIHTGKYRRREEVMGLTWSPDGSTLATGSSDGVRLWDATTLRLVHTFSEQRGINGLAWSPDGQWFASTAYDETVCIWNPAERQLVSRIAAGDHPALAWSSNSKLLAFAQDSAISIREVATGKTLHVLEAHSTEVRALSFSFDGDFLASRASLGDASDDNQVFLWRTDQWKITKIIKVKNARYIFGALAFSPTQPLLACSSDHDTSVTIWRYDVTALKAISATTRVVYYKNAKVALIGNSGVGKSGLALVLNNRGFTPTESTHGRTVTELSKVEYPTGDYRIEIREIALWDLAGQPGYRLIHQLHLDDVDIGLVVFDSKDESDPLAGVRHWNRALDSCHFRGPADANIPLCKILVAARVDRGPVGVGKVRIDQLKQELGFSDYFETSAREGFGIDELKKRF